MTQRLKSLVHPLDPSVPSLASGGKRLDNEALDRSPSEADRWMAARVRRLVFTGRVKIKQVA